MPSKTSETKSKEDLPALEDMDREDFENMARDLLKENEALKEKLTAETAARERAEKKNDEYEQRLGEMRVRN